MPADAARHFPFARHGRLRAGARADRPGAGKEWGPFLEEFCAHLRTLGADAHPCHIGQFDYRDGRVWLGDRAVDIIHRIFLVEDLLESPDAPALMDQVVSAAAAGEVKLFVPLDAEVYASKTTLAMLSDEDNRRLLAASPAYWRAAPAWRPTRAW
ncbi:hypothetical protein [Streptomyces sp. NBC_01089]|uniref:hypothetical protein n=1 Tax=Streptomyces sp. NBC_01089 TaxID=2903747 RepID=UPI00386A86C7|nr:hypothetical protein OG510_20285 [Streptomyces sp. NBC_01089]